MRGSRGFKTCRAVVCSHGRPHRWMLPRPRYGPSALPIASTYTPCDLDGFHYYSAARWVGGDDAIASVSQSRGGTGPSHLQPDLHQQRHHSRLPDFPVRLTTTLLDSHAGHHIIGLALRCHNLSVHLIVVEEDLRQ